MAAQGNQVGIAADPPGPGQDATHPPPFVEQALDRLAMTELDPQASGQGRQAAGEHVAVAGLITGQPQTTRHLLAYPGQCGLPGDAAVPVEQRIGHAELIQHAHIGEGVIHLSGGTE